jgi:hypothetical protein
VAGGRDERDEGGDRETLRYMSRFSHCAFVSSYGG